MVSEQAIAVVGYGSDMFLTDWPDSYAVYNAAVQAQFSLCRVGMKMWTWHTGHQYKLTAFSSTIHRASLEMRFKGRLTMDQYTYVQGLLGAQPNVPCKGSQSESQTTGW